MSTPGGTPSSLRIVFFGTPAFAVPTLERLVRSPHHVVGVVTQPDRPRDRGQRRREGAVKRVAVVHGLPVLQPDRASDPALLDQLGNWRPELGVVAAYGHILSEPLLNSPRLGMINVHASLLPAYRGAAPIHRAVIAGETETGITIIRVIKALDAGPILGRVTCPIGPEQTSAEVERALATLGASLLMQVVDEIAAGVAVETPQNDRLATYAPRLAKAEGLIDWTQPASRVHDRVRGLHPWPHAFTYLGGARLIVLKSRVETNWEARSRGTRPGEIVVASDHRLVVTCGDASALDLLSVQLEGRKPLGTREFLSGQRVRAGQVFEARSSST